jgi:hypothetical protein
MKTIFHRLSLLSLIILAGSCSKNNSSQNDGPSAGVAGSMARFAITNDHLYTVSDHSISAYNLSDATAPAKRVTKSLGFGIETIYPKGNTLFIGTQTGMKILDVTQPDNPNVLSNFVHWRSCDPVVANDAYAYVTLRTGTTCFGGINELQVLDIANLKQPKMVKIYPMTKPHGLALDGKNLFICDAGIKHYDATDPANLILKRTITSGAEDLIANDGILMAIGPDGLTQYSYQTGELVLLSHIPTL